MFIQHRRCVCVVFMLAVFSPTIVHATIRYVNSARPDDSGTGLSWATAEKTLRAALAAATSGDQIWVAAGTYKPDQGPGAIAGDRTATFQLKTGVAVYGGFAGTEALVSQRDPVVNVTTLSGDLSGNDAPVACAQSAPDCNAYGQLCVNGFCIIASNNADNSYHVVVGSGMTATSLLDGFTITAANADLAVGDNQRGGGMFNDTGSPTVTNCVFRGNSAINTGSAMFNRSSNPTVTDCTFSGNGPGGAMHNQTSSPKVTDCTFRTNAAGGSGAGMQNFSNSDPAVTRCTFEGNTSSNNGGGMHNSFSSDPKLTNCIFTGNSAVSGGGGIYNSDSSNPAVTNCIFSGNSANFGGGMTNGGTSPSVTNCTFAGNSANNSGGGIYNISGGNPTATNCIFWGNSDSGGMDESAQIHSIASTPTVNYSIVHGGWTGAGGTGNSAGNPLFVDADGADDDIGTLDDDVRVSAASPAIDAGNSTALPADTADLDGDFDTLEQVPFDLASNPRRLDHLFASDTGVGPAPVVDMGAYELRINVIYVDASATGANDGSSWTNAFPDLQDALVFGSTVREIWVADGTYMPDGARTPTEGVHVNGSGDRTATFQILGGVSLYGGFAGNETLVSERDPLVNVTTLSGDLAGNDGPEFANNAENSYHVLAAGSLDFDALLNGFTVTGGNADGASPNDSGGGLYASGPGAATLWITNCVFREHSAQNEGGAIFTVNNLVLTDCKFLKNRSLATGGAIQIENGYLTATRCFFLGNTAVLGAGGGAVCHHLGASTTLSSCLFSGNTANGLFGEGGAILASALPNPVHIFNCTLTGNAASTTGGIGVYPPGGADISNSILWGNTGVFAASVEDAQLHSAGGPFLIDHSTVQGWTGSLGGTGNIGADPLFVDADGVDNLVGTEDDNLRLPADSPAIDSGNNGAVQVSTDLDGITRILDGDGDSTATVDMGAYEFFFDCNLNGFPDSEDIANLTSTDVDMNGIPDDCGMFTGGCAPSQLWTCVDNWNIPGDLYPDVDSAPDVSVVLPSGFVVELDESVLIRNLRIHNGAELEMLTPDTSLDVDDAVRVNGTLTMASCRLAQNTPPTMTIGAGGRFQTAPCESAGAPSSVTAAEIQIQSDDCNTPPCGDGGQVDLEESIVFTSTGAFIIDGVNIAARNVSRITAPPRLLLTDNSTVNVAASLTVTGEAELLNSSSTGVLLQGDFDNQATSPSLFDWTVGRLTLDGSVEQNFEVAGIDLGPTPEGYDTDADTLFDTAHHTNFSIGTLEIAASSDVVFRNTFANTVAVGPCQEALYVDTLVLMSGAMIALEDVKIYYRDLIDGGATVTQIGCGELEQVACPLAAPVTPESNVQPKNRYLSFTTGNPGEQTAIRVKLVSLPGFPSFNGQARWVGQPVSRPEGPSGGTFMAAPLQCTPHFMDWGGVGQVHAYGAAVVPGSMYDVQVVHQDCSGTLTDESVYSAALPIPTGKWADVVIPYGNGQPNFSDISALVAKFQSSPTAIIKARAQLQPNVPNPAAAVNFSDISACVSAFGGAQYPYTGPTTCP